MIDMSFSPTPNKRMKKRLAARVIGKKRIKKLTKIEKRQRKRFNKLLRCPSCSEKFGTNIGCVACQLRSGQRNDIL